jgi:hypothetical protein
MNMNLENSIIKINSITTKHYILSNVNLLQDALSKAKSKMDVKFDSNRITPGHPDYVWDKEVEFHGAEENCDWDEESD